MATWVLCDANSVMARMFYALPPSSHGGFRNEAIFGFAREMHLVSGRLGVPLTHFVFFFDSQDRSLRRAIVPGYKTNAKRDGYLAGTSKAKTLLNEQNASCRNDFLPTAGYAPHWVKGYEADDLIASACRCMKEDDRAYIVSNDSDLLQLLAPRIRLFNHRTGQTFTAKQFKADWHIHPADWATVKAIAGCESDDVKGVMGAGELTAARYVLDPRSIGEAIRAAIETHKKTGQYLNNLKVVKLPFDGTPKVKLRPVESPDWKTACKSWGLKYVHVKGA